jgi:flagellar biosynthetic protein FliQ
MSVDLAVELGRKALAMAGLLAAPLLIVGLLVSLLVNVAQVLTSLQESTLSTIPKLAAVAAAAFLLMPWMMRQLTQYTGQLLSDFRPFLQ